MCVLWEPRNGHLGGAASWGEHSLEGAHQTLYLESTICREAEGTGWRVAAAWFTLQEGDRCQGRRASLVEAGEAVALL